MGVEQTLEELAVLRHAPAADHHPFRWLEENTPATRAWVSAQHRATMRYLARLPLRDAILRRLGELMGVASAGNMPDSFDVLPSPGGEWIAEGIAPQGGDRHRWRLVAAGSTTGRTAGIDELEDVQPGSLAWSADGTMLFYDRLLPWLGGHALYAHRPGTPQRADQLLLYRPDEPAWHYQPQPTEESRYLVVSVLQGTLRHNALWLLDLAQPQQPPLPLISDFNGCYELIGNVGSRFWLWVEDASAPLGCVMALEIKKPDRSQWEVVIPGGSQLLQRVQWLGEWLVAYYLDHATALIRLFDRQGHLLDTIDPCALGYGLGTVEGDGWLDEDGNFCFVYSDLVTPPVVVRHAPPGDSPRRHKPRPPASSISNHDPTRYVTTRHFVTSTDGTAIPLFLCRRKDAPDQPCPTLLSFYGGFNSAITPSFDPAVLVWLEIGGIFALASLRGGGEYGRPWHQAALGRNKQRTFDDALAVARWLVHQGITTPAQLGLTGSSNGGLTVAACLTQAPEAFGAAVIEAGLLDMVRFPHLGIGSQWVCEYGSPDDPDDEAALRAYSPLHQLRSGCRYPPTLLLVDAGDQRVGAAHSYKFAAALQAAQPAGGTVLLHVSRDQGHGEWRLPAQQQEIDALRLSFLAHTLGLEAAPSGTGDGNG